MELRVIEIRRHRQIPNPYPAFGEISGGLGALQPLWLFCRIIETERRFHTEHAGFFVGDVGIVAGASDIKAFTSPVRPNVFGGTTCGLLVLRISSFLAHQD